MKFFRHLKLLLKEFWGYAKKHKAWWILPIIFILLLISILLVISSTTAPFIYTLF